MFIALLSRLIFWEVYWRMKSVRIPSCQLLEVLEEAEEEEQEDDEIVEVGIHQTCKILKHTMNYGLHASMLRRNCASGFFHLQEFQVESRGSWWLERRDPGRSVGGKNKC